jgi:hypothetical protein
MGASSQMFVSGTYQTGPAPDIGRMRRRDSMDAFEETTMSTDLLMLAIGALLSLFAHLLPPPLQAPFCETVRTVIAVVGQQFPGAEPEHCWTWALLSTTLGLDRYI